MYVCTYIYIYIYTYIHTCTHIRVAAAPVLAVIAVPQPPRRVLRRRELIAYAIKVET